MLKWTSGGSLDISDYAYECQRMTEKRVDSPVAVCGSQRQLRGAPRIMETFHRFHHEREGDQIDATPVKTVYKADRSYMRDRSVPRSPQNVGSKGSQDINPRKGGIINKFKKIFKRSSSKGPGSKSAPNSPTPSSDSHYRMGRSLTSDNVLDGRLPSKSGKDRKSRLERLIDSRRGHRGYIDKSFECKPRFGSPLPDNSDDQHGRMLHRFRHSQLREQASRRSYTADESISFGENGTNRKPPNKNMKIDSPQIRRRASSLKADGSSQREITVSERQRFSINYRKSDTCILPMRQGEVLQMNKPIKRSTSIPNRDCSSSGVDVIKEMPLPRRHSSLLRATRLGLSPQSNNNHLQKWLEKVKQIDPPALLKVKTSLKKIKVDRGQVKQHSCLDNLGRIVESSEKKFVWSRSKDGSVVVSPKTKVKNSHFHSPESVVFQEKSVTKNNNNGHRTVHRQRNIDNLDEGLHKQSSFISIHSVTQKPSRRTSFPMTDFKSELHSTRCPTTISHYHPDKDDCSRVRRIVSTLEKNISTASGGASPTMPVNVSSTSTQSQSIDSVALQDQSSCDIWPTVNNNRVNNTVDPCLISREESGFVSSTKNTSSEPSRSQGFLPTFSCSADCVNGLSVKRDLFNSDTVKYSTVETVSPSSMGQIFVQSENNSESSISCTLQHLHSVEDPKNTFESTLHVVLTKPEESTGVSESDWNINIVPATNNISQDLETDGNHTVCADFDDFSVQEDSGGCDLSKAFSDQFCGGHHHEAFGLEKKPIQPPPDPVGQQLTSRIKQTEDETPKQFSNAVVSTSEVSLEKQKSLAELVTGNRRDKYPPSILQEKQEDSLTAQICITHGPMDSQCSLHHSMTMKKDNSRLNTTDTKMGCLDYIDLQETITKDKVSAANDYLTIHSSIKQTEKFTKPSHFDEYHDLNQDLAHNLEDKTMKFRDEDGQLLKHCIRGCDNVFTNENNFTNENDECELQEQNKSLPDHEQKLNMKLHSSLTKCAAGEGNKTPVGILSESCESKHSHEFSYSSMDKAIIGSSYSSSDITSYDQACGEFNSTFPSDCLNDLPFISRGHGLRLQPGCSPPTNIADMCTQTVEAPKTNTTKEDVDLETYPLVQNVSYHIPVDEIKIDPDRDKGVRVKSNTKERITPQATRLDTETSSVESWESITSEFIDEKMPLFENENGTGKCGRSDNCFKTGKISKNSETTYSKSHIYQAPGEEGVLQDITPLINEIPLANEYSWGSVTGNGCMKRFNSVGEIEGDEEDSPVLTAPLVENMSHPSNVIKSCKPKTESPSTYQWQISESDEMADDYDSRRSNQSAWDSDCDSVLGKGYRRIVNTTTRGNAYRLSPYTQVHLRMEEEKDNDEVTLTLHNQSVDSVSSRIAAYYNRLHADKIQFYIDTSTKAPVKSLSDFGFSSSFVSEMSANGSGDRSQYCDNPKNRQAKIFLAPFPHHVDVEMESAPTNNSHASPVTTKKVVQSLREKRLRNSTTNHRTSKIRYKTLVTNVSKTPPKMVVKRSYSSRDDRRALHVKTTHGGSHIKGGCQEDFNTTETLGGKHDTRKAVAAVSKQALQNEQSDRDSSVAGQRHQAKRKEFPGTGIEYKPEQWLFLATMLFFQFIIHWLYAR